jgi:hypothetical protein
VLAHPQCPHTVSQQLRWELVLQPLPTRFGSGGILFVRYVLKLFRIKDFTTLEALDVFYVVFARHNSDFGMLAGCVHVGVFGVGNLALCARF